MGGFESCCNVNVAVGCSLLVCAAGTDLDQAVVDSGVSENGQFQSSELKKVGQYTLSVSENCDGVSSGRSVEQTVSAQSK